MAEKIILYLGNDETFFQELNEFYSFGESYLIFQIDLEDSSWRQRLFTHFEEKLPHMVFIDFVGLANKPIAENITKIMMLFKKHNHSKAVPFFALFENKKELNIFKSLFSCGVLYGYIKEGIYTTLFRDAFYIALSGRTAFPRYAMGMNINLTYPISVAGSVIKMNANSISIETDIQLPQKTGVNADFFLFPDFIAKQFEVTETKKIPYKYDYMHAAELKIPYPNPWDEIEEDSMQKSTVETWLELNNEKFEQFQQKVLIVNDDFKFILSVADYKKDLPLEINYCSNIDRRFKVIEKLRPAVIFFQLIDKEEEDDEESSVVSNTLDSLSRIVNHIRITEGYEPVIVTFSNPSTSAATQKFYGYFNIMAIQAPIDFNFVGELINLYHKANKDEEDDEIGTVYLKISDIRRYMEIKEEVTITSLTEHELTFVTSKELPLYSVIKLDTPVEMYLTIVPPTRDLAMAGGKTHYMAFIHSLPEDDKKIIRKFVNQIIFEPLEEFVYEEDKYTQDEISPEEASEVAKQKVLDSVEEKVEEKGPRYEVRRGRAYSGKSKL